MRVPLLHHENTGDSVKKKMTLAEFQSRGGKSKSPAKIRAVIANLQKAREAKAAKKGEKKP